MVGFAFYRMFLRRAYRILSPVSFELTYRFNMSTKKETIWLAPDNRIKTEFGSLEKRMYYFNENNVGDTRSSSQTVQKD